MQKALMPLVVAGVLLVQQPAEAGVIRGIKRFARGCITLPIALVGGMYVGYQTWKIMRAFED